ncbi:MAG: hypothetical protein JWO98_4400 [Frankiales bacterium]|nr:hypothetical protein [Frankiales bacterium]
MTAVAAALVAPPAPAHRPVVLFVDVEPWEGFLQFAAALRRRGVRVERLTSASRTRVRRFNDLLQRPVFSRVRAALPASDPGAAGAALLAAEPLAGLRAVEAVEQVAAALAGAPGLPRRTADAALEPLLYDKLAMNDHLEASGLPVPRSFLAEAAHPLTPPFIVKPRLGSGGAEVIRVTDDADAAAAARQALAHPGTLMAQELLPGEVVHVGGVAKKGTVLQLGCYRAVGSPHSAFGPSAELLTVADGPTAEHAAALVAALGYTGAFCLDYVRDGDGRALIVDVNARVFGSWAALQAAGLDLVGAWLYAWGLSAESPVGELPAGLRLRTLPPDMALTGHGSLTAALRAQLRGVVQGADVLGPRWVASTVCRLLCAAAVQAVRRPMRRMRSRQTGDVERGGAL